MNYNEIKLSGTINNIIENECYVLVGLTCMKYSKTEINNLVFASLRVYKDLYEKNRGLFLLDKKVYVKGYLNSYSDKNKKIHNYVTVTKIEDYDFERINEPIIGLDFDGVETWNGKRLEPNLATLEEQEEMQRMIDEVTGARNE
jgi:hypothetical protein